MVFSGATSSNGGWRGGGLVLAGVLNASRPRGYSRNARNHAKVRAVLVQGVLVQGMTLPSSRPVVLVPFLGPVSWARFLVAFLGRVSWLRFLGPVFAGAGSLRSTH